MCDEEKVWALRVSQEHKRMLDKFLSGLKSFREKKKANPDVFLKEDFEQLIELEQELVMFECANDLPMTNWADLV